MLAAACLTSISYAQTREVSGRVVSTDGTPIAGVSISVVGSSTSTQTNASGNFKLSVPAGATLNVSSIGYISQKVSIGNSSQLSIVLNQQENALDEVIITGAGLTASRKSIGSAQTTIKGQELILITELCFVVCVL